MFLDFHAHILPEVDDGAKDIEESLKLLEISYEQGITAIIATPHFYAHEQSIEDFKQEIESALNLINENKKDRKIPKIYVGSEVFYFSNIGKSSGIKDLTIGNTNYLLLELPYGTISSDILKDIENLAEMQGLIPVIAHIERYSKHHGYKKLLKLVKSGVCLAQINAASFLQTGYKKAVCNLISNGYITFIGSDAHSVEFRPPLIKEAMESILQVFGSEAFRKLESNANHFMKILDNSFESEV